jgi:hypothetical protein
MDAKPQGVRHGTMEALISFLHPELSLVAPRAAAFIFNF